MTLAYPTVELGTMVRFTAPGSRHTEGVPRRIPAVVLGQWADGSLQLYALHFEGSFLVNSIPYADVEIPGRRDSEAAEEMRMKIAELENRLAAMGKELDTLQEAVLQTMRATGRTAPANAAH